MKAFLSIVLLSFAWQAFAQDYIGAKGPMFESKKYDFPMETGLIVPPPSDRKDEAVLDMGRLYAGALPAKFSWKDEGKTTPIRNQGSCGSCWAFSMSATMADVLEIFGDVIDADLSEQYLVSCQTEYYGCRGGWMEFRMFLENGNVWETDFPYKAKDLACPNNLSYHHKIKNWGYVAGSSSIPDPELLKRAIYTFGPVSVAVAAVGDFMNYSSGIYNGSASGGLNHAVNLVGWDDTASVPHWIMRNSWGSNWGENGWMKIAYGSRKIGYAATFIDYKGEIGPDPTPDPTPDPPCGNDMPWYFIILPILAVLGIVGIVKLRKS